MLIDLFYLWGEKWVDLYDNGYNIMAGILVLTALVLYSLTTILIIYNFKWYPCNNKLNITNLIFVIIITGLTVSGIP